MTQHNSSSSHGPRGLGIDLTEFKRAWRIVVLATLGLAINSNSSMLYAYGAMMVPLQQTFDWARADLQSAVSFMFLGSVVASQIVGWLNLRFGMKRVTVISLCVLSLTFMGMTRMGPSIVTLYLSFFLMSMASMGTMHVTWTHLVNLWFEHNRGLALALVLSGTGLAAMLIPSAVSAVITRWNWQAAFWLLAALPVTLVLPLVLAWMKEPTRAPARTPSKQASSSEWVAGVSLREGVRNPVLAPEHRPVHGGGLCGDPGHERCSLAARQGSRSRGCRAHLRQLWPLTDPWGGWLSATWSTDSGRPAWPPWP